MFSLEGDNNCLDEVTNYLNGRYISSNEAVWQLLMFPVHERTPTVMHLDVHLENGERIYFTEETARQRVAERRQTKLTGFFSLCQTDEFARTLLYCDMAKYYTWASNKFKRRLWGTPEPGHHGVFASDTLGRIYTVHPSNTKCFYLRMLLHVVVGLTSFEHLKTVDGRMCKTYREACHQRSLLEDDNHWHKTMEEAVVCQVPHRLRTLFSIILSCCNPSDPKGLWVRHRDYMTEDILYQAQRRESHVNITFTDAMYNKALCRIDDQVHSMSGRGIEMFGLDAPQRNATASLSREVLRERSYDVANLQQFVTTNEVRLNEGQRKAYEAIKTSVEQQQGKMLFLDAPGGTGKTFVINLILAYVHGVMGEIALAVASSGIAATLLPGGRAAHSTFKLLLNLATSDSPVCNISKGTGPAKLLKSCKLIVYDECTMAHNKALEALDQTLRDIRGNDRLMGGVMVLLSGDFRQTLPIIPKGTPADELNACLKVSPLWPQRHQLQLHENMRVTLMGNDKSAKRFSETLLKVGEGKLPLDSNRELGIPEGFGTVVSQYDSLLNKVYPDFVQKCKDPNYLSERAILAPLNNMVDRVNNRILARLPGAQRQYLSVDTPVHDSQVVEFPA